MLYSTGCVCVCVCVCVWWLWKRNTFTAVRLTRSVMYWPVYHLAFSGTGRTGHLQHYFYHRRNFILPHVAFLRFSMLQLIYFCSILLRFHIAKAVNSSRFVRPAKMCSDYAGGWTGRGSNLGRRQEIFRFRGTSRPAFGPKVSLIRWVPGGFYRD